MLNFLHPVGEPYLFAVPPREQFSVNTYTWHRFKKLQDAFYVTKYRAILNCHRNYRASPWRNSHYLWHRFNEQADFSRCSNYWNMGVIRKCYFM